MQIARNVVPELGDPLTPREREIAALIAKGESLKQVAEDLGISLGTVRVYSSRIHHKTGTKDRVEVALWFRGLLQVPPPPPPPSIDGVETVRAYLDRIRGVRRGREKRGRSK